MEVVSTLTVSFLVSTCVIRMRPVGLATVKIKDFMEINKNPTFLFSFFSPLVFLLLVIYSNDRGIKRCFAGKSRLQFYGL